MGFCVIEPSVRLQVEHKVSGVYCLNAAQWRVRPVSSLLHINATTEGFALVSACTVSSVANATKKKVPVSVGRMVIGQLGRN